MRKHLKLYWDCLVAFWRGGRSAWKLKRSTVRFGWSNIRRMNVHLRLSGL